MAEDEQLVTMVDRVDQDDALAIDDTPNVDVVVSLTPRTVHPLSLPAHLRLVATMLAAISLVVLLVQFVPKPSTSDPSGASAFFSEMLGGTSTARMPHKVLSSLRTSRSNSAAMVLADTDPDATATAFAEEDSHITLLESLSRLANASLSPTRVLDEFPHVPVPSTPWQPVIPAMSGDTQAEIADCTIDIAQSLAYIGTVALNVRAAMDACPKSSRATCSANIAAIITSLSWCVSYLSFAATSCTHTINAKATCAGSASWVIGAFGEFAFATSAIVADCTNYWSEVRDDFKSAKEKVEEHTEKWKEHKEKLKAKVEGWWLHHHSKTSTITTTTITTTSSWRHHWSIHKTLWQNAYGKLKARTDRAASISACTFSGVQASSYLVRAALQIRAAAETCPNPQECTIEVMNVISSFAWIANYIALMVSDCPIGSNSKAYCAADSADLVAAVTTLVAGAASVGDDCDPHGAALQPIAEGGEA